MERCDGGASVETQAARAGADPGNAENKEVLPMGNAIVMETPEGSVVDPLDLTALDVTGIHRVELEGIDGHRLAGEVAESVAESLDLPDDFPWTLRDSGRARMLEDDRALGAQVASGTEVVLVPKAHLA